MKGNFGIILIEEGEVITRVYTADDKEWKLLQYKSQPIPRQDNENRYCSLVTQALINLSVNPVAKDILEWKICSRNISKTAIKIISHMSSFTIEDLTQVREQELLCKGMFTELW